MLRKGSKLFSVLFCKCPKCHEGNMFEGKGAYDLKNLTKMNSECSYCGEKFLREPGFFFGAAYVSYGITVALWIAVLLALMTFNTIGLIEYSFYKNPTLLLVSGIVVLIILLPLLYRVSRSLWINFFVNYDATTAKK